MPSYHEICRAPARQTAIYQMLVKFRDDKKLDIFRYIQIYLEYNNLIQVNLDIYEFNLGKFRHI